MVTQNLLRTNEKKKYFRTKNSTPDITKEQRLLLTCAPELPSNIRDELPLVETSRLIELLLSDRGQVFAMAKYTQFIYIWQESIDSIALIVSYWSLQNTPSRFFLSIMGI